MRSIVTAALIVAVAVTVPVAAPAQAAPASKRAQIRELKAQVKHQRASLRRKSTAVKKSRRQIARLRRQLAAAMADRPPAALATAVEQVRREAEYVQRYNASWPRAALIANSAMNYVTGHVTAPGYGYMNVVLGIQPIPVAESVLQAGAGICGHAALTYAAIMKRFNIPVRSVQFYYADGVHNHIANEVFYGGAWHYYDPTWGAYYSDGSRVLSITEARSRPDPRSLLHQDDVLFWRWVQREVGAPNLAAAASDSATRVEIGQQKFPG